MDGKLYPGIQPLTPLKFSPPSFRENPPFNQEIFQTPPFLKFWLESQTPPLERKGWGGWGGVGGGVPTTNQLHSGNTTYSTNSIRNLSHFSLSCEHDIETYDGVRY